MVLLESAMNFFINLIPVASDPNVMTPDTEANNELSHSVLLSLVETNDHLEITTVFLLTISVNRLMVFRTSSPESVDYQFRLAILTIFFKVFQIPFQ